MHIGRSPATEMKRSGIEVASMACAAKQGGNMIKGVLFDMDGTMLDTEPISMACWRKSAAHFDITIDDELMDTFFGKNLVAIEEILRNAFGIDEEAVKIVEGRQVYYRAHLEEYGAPLKPGLIEILEYLKSKKIPAVVCTSTDKVTGEKLLKKVGVYDYFDDFVYGDMVTRSKPDPQGFQMAAKAIGQESSECLVVEDSPNGVLAGKAAGGYVIFVEDKIALPEDVYEGITAEMPSLHEIILWIEEANNL